MYAYYFKLNKKWVWNIINNVHKNLFLYFLLDRNIITIDLFLNPIY